MYEGILILHENHITVRHFKDGEVVFSKLRAGQEIEIYQNGYWHKVKVHSPTDEPYIADWEYGDCIGCDVKMSDGTA